LQVPLAPRKMSDPSNRWEGSGKADFHNQEEISAISIERKLNLVVGGPSVENYNVKRKKITNVTKHKVGGGEGHDSPFR